jgi:hypothetical protein
MSHFPASPNTGHRPLGSTTLAPLPEIQESLFSSIQAGPEADSARRGLIRFFLRADVKKLFQVGPFENLTQLDIHALDGESAAPRPHLSIESNEQTQSPSPQMSDVS